MYPLPIPRRRPARGRLLLAATTAALTAAALLTAIPPAHTVPLHRVSCTSPGPLAEGDVIYQVLVDRFSDGNSANNNTGHGEYNPSDLGFYHGGDWQGLTNKLGYIKDLGVTAIWISPVADQEPLSRDGTEASYHGYFTHDYA